jgi:hypothetical protein
VTNDGSIIMGNQPVEDRPGERAGTAVPTVVVDLGEKPAAQRLPSLVNRHAPTAEGSGRPPQPSAAATTDASGATPAPRAAGNQLPPPVRRSRPLPVATPRVTTPPPADAAPPVPDHPPGPTQTTAIAAPPPPPPAAGPQPPLIVSATARKSDPDVTQVVAPLPPPFAQAPKGRGRSPSPRVIVEAGLAEPGTSNAQAEVLETPAGAPGPRRLDRSRRIRAGAIGAAVLIAAILVVAIGFSSNDVAHVPAAAGIDRPVPVASPREPEPTAEPLAAAPQDSAPQGAAQQPPEVPASQPDAPPSEESRAAAATPHPAKRPRLRSPAPERTAKPAGHARTKPTRPLTYDPDALFLGKR